MSATVGVLTVLGVIGALLALHKLAQRRERKRMLARKAERDAYFEKQDRQRVERLEWHMQRTAESLRAQQDREKVTAMEQQRLQQAGDVVEQLASAMTPAYYSDERLMKTDRRDSSTSSSGD